MAKGNAKLESAIKTAILNGELERFLREKCYLTSSHEEKDTLKVVSEIISKIYLEPLEILSTREVNWNLNTTSDVLGYLNFVKYHKLFKSTKSSADLTNLRRLQEKVRNFFNGVDNIKTLNEVISFRLKKIGEDQ